MYFNVSLTSTVGSKGWDCVRADSDEYTGTQLYTHSLLSLVPRLHSPMHSDYNHVTFDPTCFACDQGPVNIVCVWGQSLGTRLFLAIHHMLTVPV